MLVEVVALHLPFHFTLVPHCLFLPTRPICSKGCSLASTVYQPREQMTLTPFSSLSWPSLVHAVKMILELKAIEH